MPFQGQKSHEFFERAQKVIPLGVSSNFRYYGDYDTPVVAKAKDGYIYDFDGKQYIAIVVGLISDNAEDWEMTYRRFAPDENLPVNDSPKGGAAIWAFALY